MEHTTSGIYGIKNALNGKIYIGSSNNIKIRWCNHKNALNHQRHDNGYLQRAWNKDGAGAFEFLILEECAVEMLAIREEAWIAYRKSTNRNVGYNLASFINGRHIHSEETKRKISAFQKTRNHTPMTEETKKRISQSNLGRKYSEEFKNKCRVRRLGVSPAHKGKHFSEEARARMSAAQLKSWRSPILIAKISEAQKKHWAEIKANPQAYAAVCASRAVSAKLGWKTRKR